MRVKRLLKIVGIALASLTILLLLFIAAFVFNPFEGRLADVRDVVPRDVDFYLRKQDLAGDFAQFPEPHFWAELRQSSAFADLQKGPTMREMNRGNQLERMFADLRDQVARVREQTSGFLDPVRDVIGGDAVVAGKFTGNRLEQAQWCLYSRVAWRTRFAWGLMGYGFVQEQMRQGGLGVQQSGDVFTFQPRGGAPIYAARHLDCVMVANDQSLLQRSLDFAKGIGGDETLGGTSTYNEGIRAPLLGWQERTKADSVNAVEVFLRPDALFARTDWDDNWPNATDPDSMNSRVLASFLNLKTWRFLTGATVFEPDSLSVIGDIELNQNKHTPFQRSFFRVESQARKDWLDPFLQMVPAEACAAAALRMPVGDFLREMIAALDQADQDLLNEGLAKTGKYRSLDEVIRKLEPAFLPRTGFVFRKKERDDVKGDQIKVAAPSPVPHTAWVFWLREGKERELVNEFLTALQASHKTIGFEQAFLLRLGLGAGGAGGDVAVEFAHPQIPGTGSIAMAVWGRYLFLSNSGPFIRTLAQTQLGRHPRLTQNEEFDFFDKELKNKLNGVIYLNGPQLERVLQDYELDIGASKFVSADFALENRSTAEGTVFRRSYAGQYAAMSAMPQAVRERFDKEVDQELETMWQRQRSSYTEQSKASIREAVAFVRLFRAAYLQVTLDARHLRFQGTVITKLR